MNRNNLNGIDDSSANVEKAAAPLTKGINIDFSHALGAVKPLHGVNNSPLSFGEPIMELKDAGIPYVRLHDTAGPFGGTYFVDIPNIFPDFDADPDDPASYDFAFTDAYLKGLASSGVNIFYRLGVTIENHWKIKPQRIAPPEDPEKWARVCAGIVRHYNEGWANGFHHDIQYWEIWNEPENPPMWTGTREQYFELYRVAANHLKKEFPAIKVGGYASCGFYALNHPELMNDFYKGFITYFDEFLKFVSSPSTSAPLDFYSWHLYSTNPREIVFHADYVDKKLKEYGMSHTESIFDEWNYVDCADLDCWESMKEMPGAAFTAAAFCLMQYSPINKAMYYDALPTCTYCGLFYFPSQKVTKTYFSFKAFNELFKLGTAVECSCDGFDGSEEVYVCAATDGKGQGAALIVNRNLRRMEIPLCFAGISSRPACMLLDSSHLLGETDNLFQGDTLTLPGLSVALLRFR